MNTSLPNAVNIKISGSIGLYTAENLEEFLSSQATVTSCLGGRLVVIGQESFLINQLARDILKQNSSPTVCKALKELYIRSDKDLATRAAPIRAAAAFREGLMWLFGTNTIIKKKMDEYTAALVKTINQQTQSDINNNRLKPDLGLVSTTTKNSTGTHNSNIVGNNFNSIPAEEDEEEDKINKPEEELFLLKREEAITKNNIAKLQKQTVDLETAYNQKITAMKEVFDNLVAGEAHEVLLLQELTLAEQTFRKEKKALESQIDEKNNFLKETTEKIKLLLEIEEYGKIFNAVVKSENFVKTTLTTALVYYN
jgi:hypothetical protein